MFLLAPSILGADFKHLEQQVCEAADAGAQYIHLDVMDGAFVPSISFGMKEAGADIISVHVEACTHLDRTVNQIKEAGLKAGVVLNPATPVDVLDCILDQVDMVLLMTVNPGFGGQKFIPYTLEKIRALRKKCDMRGLSTDIEVDGGVTCDNVRELMEAGANVFVAGSAIFKGDVTANTKAFLKIFEEQE